MPISFCSNSFEITKPVYRIQNDNTNGGFLGIYNPDPSDLVDAVTITGTRNRRQAVILPLVFGTETVPQPVTCIDLNDLIMFDVSLVKSLRIAKIVNFLRYADFKKKFWSYLMSLTQDKTIKNYLRVSMLNFNVW